MRSRNASEPASSVLSSSPAKPRSRMSTPRASASVAGPSGRVPSAAKTCGNPVGSRNTTATSEGANRERVASHRASASSARSALRRNALVALRSASARTDASAASNTTFPLAWALRRARVPMVMLAASSGRRIMRIDEARPAGSNDSGPSPPLRRGDSQRGTRGRPRPRRRTPGAPSGRRSVRLPGGSPRGRQ